MSVSPSPDQSNSRQGPNLQLILLGLVLLVLVLLAVLMFSRLGSIEGRLGQLSEEWTEVAGSIDESGRRSEEALALAKQADVNASRAARQRDDANRRRQLAEHETSVARQEASSARDEMARMQEEQEVQLQQLELNLNKIAETRRTALGLVLNLGSDVMKFDFDKANLKPQHRELLSRVVGILLTLEGYGVYVYGHTDDVGSPEYNLQLSKRRAESVRDYLVESGIDPGIITTDGFGQDRPLISASSADARAKNRRVEIGVINTRINYERSIP